MLFLFMFYSCKQCAKRDKGVRRLISEQCSMSGFLLGFASSNKGVWKPATVLNGPASTCFYTVSYLKWVVYLQAWRCSITRYRELVILEGVSRFAGFYKATGFLKIFYHSFVSCRVSFPCQFCILSRWKPAFSRGENDW